MLDRFKYTDKEMDRLLQSLVILVDTREQKNDHILQYLDKAGVEHKKKALAYGDYSFFIPADESLDIPRDLYFDKEIIVERKGSLEELSNNLTKERDRLEKEFCLAPEHKVLLIENATYFDKEIIVERKGSLEELSNNLTKERDRLEKEFCLAPEHKVLLIENATYEDMVTGKYDSKYNNKSFWASLHSFWHKYNIPAFFLADHTYSGFFIRGYFEYYLKNCIR